MRAGSTVARRPECTRKVIASRPARMPSSSCSSGLASVTHSRAVSTPPARSVHPIGPRGSLEPAPPPHPTVVVVDIDRFYFAGEHIDRPRGRILRWGPLRSRGRHSGQWRGAGAGGFLAAGEAVSEAGFGEEMPWV